MKLLSTNQAAEKLGISVRRVRALIAEGTLAAHQLGREYAIEEAALSSVTVYGKAGRPPKSAEGTGEASTATDAPDDGAPSPVTRKKPAEKARKKRRDQ